jgi:hypothetical protein
MTLKEQLFNDLNPHQDGIKITWKDDKRRKVIHGTVHSPDPNVVFMNDADEFFIYYRAQGNVFMDIYSFDNFRGGFYARTIADAKKIAELLTF